MEESAKNDNANMLIKMQMLVYSLRRRQAKARAAGLTVIVDQLERHLDVAVRIRNTMEELFSQLETESETDKVPGDFRRR